MQTTRSSQDDDAALIVRARAGDPAARNDLIARHLPEVYALTLRVLGDRDQAEDAAQEALINAVNGLARFRGDASFRTWLLRIAINAARQIGRRSSRRREVSLVLASDEQAPERDPAAQTVMHSEAQRAQRLLLELPPRQREIVALRAAHELSYREIAALVGGTEGAARVNYHLGIKRLRELMQ